MLRLPQKTAIINMERNRKELHLATIKVLIADDHAVVREGTRVIVDVPM